MLHCADPRRSDHGHACQFLPGGINSSLREAEAERRLQEEEARPNRLEKVAERVPKYPFRWNRHIVERDRARRRCMERQQVQVGPAPHPGHLR